MSDKQTLRNAVDDLETISGWMWQHPDWEHEAEALDYCIERIKDSTEIDND